MYFSNKMIYEMGYTDITDFLKDSIKLYSNCSIIHTDEGVHINYDMDSREGIPNIGTCDNSNNTGDNNMEKIFTIKEYRKILQKIQLFCSDMKSETNKDWNKKKRLTDFERGVIQGKHSAYNEVNRKLDEMVRFAEYDSCIYTPYKCFPSSILFRGFLTKLPENNSNYRHGDLIIVNGKEYYFNGNQWINY